MHVPPVVVSVLGNVLVGGGVSLSYKTQKKGGRVRVRSMKLCAFNLSLDQKQSTSAK